MTDPTHAEAAAMEAATPPAAEEPRYIWVISHREHAGDDAVMFHASTEAKAMEWLATEHKDPCAAKTGYYCLVKEPVDVRIEDGGICTLIGFYSLTGELLDDQPEVPGLVVGEDKHIVGRREDPLDAAVREFCSIWPGPEIQHFAARRLREHLAVAQKRRDQRELEIKAARAARAELAAEQEKSANTDRAIEEVTKRVEQIIAERDHLRRDLCEIAAGCRVNCPDQAEAKRRIIALRTELDMMNKAAGEVNDALGVLDLCMVVPLVKDLQAKVDSLTEWKESALRELARASERDVLRGQDWNTREKERDAALALLDATLKALPVGNIQAHTRESIPERVAELVERYARETQIVEDLRDELDDLKAGVYPQRFAEWSEEDGCAIWWAVHSEGTISEPPHHLGTPTASDWPYEATDEPHLLWVPLPKLASDRPLPVVSE